MQSKKIYLNTGSCQLGRFQAITLNTETLRFETLKFKDKNHLYSYYRNEVKK